jgi:hypothetical protein
VGVAYGFLLAQYIAYNDFALDLTSSQDPGVFKRYQAFIRLSKTTTGKMSCMIGYLDAEGFRNCGILRYWTLSNLPLFLLATPVISVMVTPGIWGLQHQRVETHNLSKGKTSEKHSIQNEADFSNSSQPGCLPTSADFAYLHNCSCTNYYKTFFCLSSLDMVREPVIGWRRALVREECYSNLDHLWLGARAGFLLHFFPQLD